MSLKAEKNRAANPLSDKSAAGDSVEYRPGKGFFLALLTVSVLLISAGAFFFWYIPTVGLGAIHPALPYVFGVVLAALLLFLIVGLGAIFVSILTGRMLFLTARFRGLLLKLFMPLMIASGKIFGVPKVRIERAVLELNNKMVLSIQKHVKPERILILMPHCIQLEDCKFKVTKDVRNCASCGKCEIADLLKIMDSYGVNLFISTGGTVARKKVVEYRPNAVIAVACERDLISGIRDAYPMPVFAIINKRPHGYCTETGVAVEDVSEAVRLFVA